MSMKTKENRFRLISRVFLVLYIFVMCIMSIDHYDPSALFYEIMLVVIASYVLLFEFYGGILLIILGLGFNILPHIAIYYLGDSSVPRFLFYHHAAGCFAFISGLFALIAWRYFIIRMNINDSKKYSMSLYGDPLEIMRKFFKDDLKLIK